MSEQSLDLRRGMQTLWRYKLLISVAVLLGVMGGVAYAVLRPPLLASRALVILPPTASQTIGTQTLIAESSPVLSAAARQMQPPLSAQTLRDRVQSIKLSTQIIAISAQGTTAMQAESTANTVARSYISYVGSGSADPSVRMPARLLEPASTATRTPAALRFLAVGLLGAMAGLLVGAVVALVAGRADRRLRGRNEIADALGIPVLAALPTEYPADAAGWAKLIEEYEPGPVEAWNLRKALSYLGLTEAGGHASSLAVLSLSCDRAAVALGPQLAAYAASLGILTSFVLSPTPDVDVTATLRTACTATTGASPRLSRLRIGVRAHDRAGQSLEKAALTVVTSVVDAEDPQVAETARTTVTVLGVSAGAATAEQLARLAVSATGDGRQIDGVLVANPDPVDRSADHRAEPKRTGRQHRRPA